MPLLIEAIGLSKTFGKARALDGLDLAVDTGQITAILGPNGAGKTTLIRTIATLLRPEAGALKVLGHDALASPAQVRRLIGLAGQAAAVEGAMSGRENLRMVGRLYGQSRRTAQRSAANVLGILDLEGAADRLVRTYSGGMRRRLDLGASLVGSPRLLLLDEPTTGLDPRSRIELWDSIRSLGASGTEILLTTQYLDEADQLAARVVIVDAGRVIADGSPAELKSQAGTDRIEVHTRDAQSLPRAASVLSGLEGNAAETDSSTRRCSVPVGDGAGILPVAMTRLTEGGVAVEDITLRRPTLDEVFLALTGHAAEERGRRPSRRAPSGGPVLPESDSCLEFEQQGAWR